MLLRSLAFVAFAASAAAAAPLKSTVGAISAEPGARLALVSSGTTAVERYHSADPGFYTPGAPVVLLLRGPITGYPDLVRVVKAEVHGHEIVIALEERQHVGPEDCTMCMIDSASLVELELGPLEKGDYHVVVDHTALEYTDEAHPEHTTKTRTWRFQRSFLITPPAPPQPRLP